MLDNVHARRAGARRSSFRFWRPLADEARARRAGAASLDEVGLAAKADVPVATLAHGEQRQLEVAMTLATRPQLLLLDEPMAGMSLAESSAWSRCSRR